MTLQATWFEVNIECHRKQVGIVTAALFALGASGTEERFRDGEAPTPRQPWDTGPPQPTPKLRVVRAWFEHKDLPLLKREIEAQLRARQVNAKSIQYAPHEPVNWQAEFERQHPPMHVSERLTISPPWCAKLGDVIIEPGIGFGTGGHTTTLQALRGLDAWADRYQTALDVGCGSGILAIAAAKLGLQAAGFDIEYNAVENAKRHAEMNSLEVDFSTRPIQDWSGPYDIILANLHAELLIELHSELVRLTGHVLITAGIMKQKADGVCSVLTDHFHTIERYIDGDWVSVIFSEPRDSS